MRRHLHVFIVNALADDALGTQALPGVVVKVVVHVELSTLLLFHLHLLELLNAQHFHVFVVDPNAQTR